MPSRRPQNPAIIDAAAYVNKHGQKPLSKTPSLPPPDRMEEADYDLFVYLHQQRINALVRALAPVPIETLLPLIQSNGGDPNALAEIKSQNTGIELLTRRYRLEDGDQLQPGGAIIRHQE